MARERKKTSEWTTKGAQEHKRRAKRRKKQQYNQGATT